jgi:hypothetical protein
MSDVRDDGSAGKASAIDTSKRRSREAFARDSSLGRRKLATSICMPSVHAGSAKRCDDWSRGRSCTRMMVTSPASM